VWLVLSFTELKLLSGLWITAKIVVDTSVPSYMTTQAVANIYQAAAAPIRP
jgi:hypothetical protein